FPDDATSYHLKPEVLAHGLYPRASTAEVDPQALQSSGAKRMRAGKPGAPAAAAGAVVRSKGRSPKGSAKR
ncbi:MAG: hypothetical protein NT147_12190, partial [Candidatus Aminicenantes bacterium]|nr:hypothetical protein [Candidatus Aminicenantes bacterium]